MKKEKFNKALNHIDYSFVEEYVVEKERIKREKRRASFVKKSAPLVATFIVFFAVLGILLGANTSMLPSTPNDNMVNGMSYENVYVFEYGGRKYCAAFMNLNFNFGDQYVSDILGEIIATDKNGNASSYKIFSSKLDTVDKEIFIEINGNYYPAYESNKNK